MAAFSADRISYSAIVLAGALCGVLVFFVAVPLALSSPFPAPRGSNWIMDRPSQHLAAPITLPPDLEQEDELVDWQELWAFVALPPSRAAAGFEPAAFGEPRSTGWIASAASPEAALEPVKPITTQPASRPRGLRP